jgi:hypothetical protein
LPGQRHQDDDGVNETDDVHYRSPGAIEVCHERRHLLQGTRRGAGAPIQKQLAQILENCGQDPNQAKQQKGGEADDF